MTVLAGVGLESPLSRGETAPAGRTFRTIALDSVLLPASAVLFLVVGGFAWALTSARGAPLPFDANLVWFVGLVCTGVPVVWRTLRQALYGHFATDLVAMLAVIGAVVLQEPLAGLVIVLMQTGGEALERLAEGRASAAVRELEAAAPRVAHRMDRDGIIDVPADAAAVGDLLLVRPGELIPCDGVVVEGESSIDASRLTGEPLPVDVRPGSALASGSANVHGPLVLRVTALARASQYARIVELVRTAQASKAPLQRLADRYALWFTPATLLVCAIAWGISGDAQRALAVLVVATPCPLILATPIAIMGGINRAARRQIVVRHGRALEQLAALTAAVFDKTGTLTLGHPAVSRVIALDVLSPDDVLRFASAVEQGAGHLLARTLVAEAERRFASMGRSLPRATSTIESPGRGVNGTVEGHRVAVGSRGYIREALHTPETLDRDPSVGSPAALRAYVAVDGLLAGIVEYADRLRSDAPEVLSELRQLGVGHLVLLSGDHAPSVRAIAQDVGMDEAHGDLLPADKVAAIEALLAAGEHVMMVGDGTNDAPAMSRATVGIALAAHGGGITAEAADVVVLADHLSRIPEAIRISRRTMRIARESLAMGLGLSAVSMVFAAAGMIAPTTGALLQEAIDIAAILNALRTSRSP